MTLIHFSRQLLDGRFLQLAEEDWPSGYKYAVRVVDRGVVDETQEFKRFHEAEFAYFDACALDEIARRQA